ncbi:MAG: flagellar hook capping FlgD N-terminal domain-containing protein [Pseudomonadota bacterium]
MDATNPTSAAGGITPALTAPRAGNTSEAATTLAQDFDTFLTLLTAQLRNQDPLEPVDSTQFVDQLATFSGVEQQVQTNQQLGSILESLGAGANSLADWVGHKVEAAAAIRFDGAPVELTTKPLAEARQAALIVTDGTGKIVDTQLVDPAANRITWDGLDRDGDPLEPGLYNFEVQRSDGPESLPSDTPKGFAQVTEARLVNGEIRLILDGGAEIAAADVTALRPAN